MKKTLLYLLCFLFLIGSVQTISAQNADLRVASAEDFLRSAPKASPFTKNYVEPVPTTPPAASSHISKPSLVATWRTGGYCVRLCDGFYFPAPLVRVNENRADVQNEICGSLCPGSATLFFGGSDIRSSVNAQGQRYPQLSTANLYKKRYDKTCSCKANFAHGVGYLRYSHDFTLKRGDIVFFENQPKVFAGGTSFPYAKENFISPKTTAWIEALKLNPEMGEKAKPYESASSWKLASVIYSVTDARIAETKANVLREVALPRKAKTKLTSLKEILAERQSYGE